MSVPLNRVVVIGAGIGGLCTAIALNKLGVNVEVFEQAPELKAVGAGITLWPNALKCFRLLGVADQVIEGGARIVRGELRDSTGRVLSGSNSTDLETKMGEPTIAIHRARLHEILHSALPAGIVHLGKRCKAIEQNGDQVTVRFDDGTTETADLLIGADGINSVIRGHLFPEAKPRYAGYCAWRGIVETTDMAALGITSEGWGCGTRFGIVRVDEKNVYWFATSNAEQGTKQTAKERKSFLLNLFKGWYSPVETLIESTPDDALLLNDIVDVEPMKSWTQGRAVLLGDAAHSTTPNMGQGACMAVESSVVLAKCLSEESELSAALDRYEKLRMPRTAWITKTSWKFGRMGQWKNPLACWFRNTVVSVASDRLAGSQLEKASRFDY